MSSFMSISDASTPAAASSCGCSSAGMSASSTCPSSLCYTQQADELENLNRRLANYIQRTQELKGEHSCMLLRLEQWDESKSREMSSVRRLYEEELADVRKSLHGLAQEKVQLEIEYKMLEARNQKENELASTVTQKAEVTLSSKEAEVTQLQSENRTLKGDVTDVQSRLKQEILEIRRRHESCLVEVDSGQRIEFESKLVERHSVTAGHKSGLVFLAQLLSPQQAAMEKSSVASATKDELETTKLRVESLSSQLQQCQKEKMSVESRCRELEEEREVWHQKLNQKEQELLKMRTQNQSSSSQCPASPGSLTAKTTLDMKISAYRKMLEVAEERSTRCPSPSQQKANVRTRKRGSRGKKRKCVSSHSLDDVVGLTPPMLEK